MSENERPDALDPGQDNQESGFLSPLLLAALALTGAIAAWGLFDAAGCEIEFFLQCQAPLSGRFSSLTHRV